MRAAARPSGASRAGCKRAVGPSLPAGVARRARMGARSAGPRLVATDFHSTVWLRAFAIWWDQAARGMRRKLLRLSAEAMRPVFEQLSVAADGTAANRAATKPSVDASGRFVAFESLADNLVHRDGNRCVARVRAGSMARIDRALGACQRRRAGRPESARHFGRRWASRGVLQRSDQLGVRRHELGLGLFRPGS